MSTDFSFKTIISSLYIDFIITLKYRIGGVSWDQQSTMSNCKLSAYIYGNRYCLQIQLIVLSALSVV